MKPLASAKDTAGSIPSRRFLHLLIIVMVCLASVAPYEGADIAIIFAAATVSLLALMSAPRYEAGLRAAVLATLGGTCILSTIWSVAPFSTLPAATAIVLLITATTLVRRVMSQQEFLEVVAVAFRVVLLVSILTAIVVPSVGLVDENYQTGALKGLFVHRNLLAFMALIALATFVALRKIRSRRVTVMDTVLSVACLLAAQSQTVLVAALGTALVIVVLRWVRRFTGFSRVIIGTLSLASILTLVYMAIFSFAEIVSGLGRDSTLTGRTDVWPAVLEQIERSPLLGLGWNAAWREGLPDTQRMWRAAGFKMYHSHDGYLDMMLQLGLVGLVLLVIALLGAIVLAVRAFVRDRIQLSAWSVAVAMALVLVNLTESPSTNFFGFFVLGAALLFATERQLVSDLGSVRPSRRLVGTAS
ncbi:O-antigen ligase family protein [Actinomycetospora succinea]|nr:O-antigen ligase family protein [Actinomycetospora succinea]